MIIITKSKIRVVPQISLALETARITGIDAREAFSDLIIDAEIQVDDAELRNIAQLEPIKQALTTVADPNQQQYKSGDWRAKGSEMRRAQWKQKPVIDYIASTHKEEVLKAIFAKLAPLPDAWRQAIMAKPTYRLETKGLQLSPTEDKKWKSIFVQVHFNLGSYESKDGFLGKLAGEFQQALANRQVQESGDQVIWKSTLTGLESMFKQLDPYAGSKMSATQIHGYDVADEAGYDMHVKEGLMDQIQSALTSETMDALGVSVESLKSISDDGTFTFTAMPPEPSTGPEQVAGDVDPTGL